MIPTQQPVKVRPVFGARNPVAPSATISPCGRYRYQLWRLWDTAKPTAVWVLLNPSIADASQDDPTLRRCVGFARGWDMGGVLIVNLFAARATDPQVLLTMNDPIGPDNDQHIRWATHLPKSRIICGWGAHPMAQRDGRADAVKHLIQWGMAWCLGTTKDGHPRHPLYLPADTRLERWGSS